MDKWRPSDVEREMLELSEKSGLITYAYMPCRQPDDACLDEKSFEESKEVPEPDLEWRMNW